jgi:hypothetical protein
VLSVSSHLPQLNIRGVAHQRYFFWIAYIFRQAHGASPPRPKSQLGHSAGSVAPGQCLRTPRLVRRAGRNRRIAASLVLRDRGAQPMRIATTVNPDRFAAEIQAQFASRLATRT